MENIHKSNLNPNKWISLYYKYLYNYTKTRVKDEYMVEDIIQETYLAGLKSLKNFENRSSERTWLISILKHKIIDYYRRSNNFCGIIEKSLISHEEYADFYNKDIQEDSYLEEEIMSGFEYDELIKTLEFNINKLPKIQAEVFTMSVIKEYETETICEKLNLTKNHVWVLKSRARKSLCQDLLKNYRS